MKLRHLLSILLLQSALLTHAGLAIAADDPESGDKAATAEENGKDKDEKKDEAGKIKPYEKVITKDAESDPGVFTVHRLKDKNKIYYEIPTSELGRDFLWVTQIAKTTLGRGYGGAAAGNRIVRWERHDKRVFLREVSYDIVADANLPIARAVEAANYHPIIMAFNIEALGPEDAPVIDVTRLYTTEIPEFSVRSALNARGFDASRSFVEKVISFPTNIEVQATHTYTAPPGGNSGPTQPGRPRAMAPGSASVLMNYSMVRLPDEPMMPRLFDDRVGYFTVSQRDFGRDEHRAVQRRFITRYRLEKKDPAAELSEPVKPIVYWIDPATPAKWVPYIKEGIEAWQVAFEAAGFKNAIIAKEAPTPEEDPEWSAEDARYSVIRWLPSTTENAMGPHIHDPRSGEIIEADVQFYHNIQNLLRNWYFLQVGPLDPRVSRLPMPDELMGKLLGYVVTHEVGHTIGFQHNMKASSMYPIDKVRDPEWVKTMGHVSTLMDYSRMNYVAQPEDGIALEDLIPKVGPYDKWATRWGYAPIPDAATPDEERPTLDAWAREQDTVPWYRFSTAGAAGSDPGDQTEAVGDADPIEATTLGLKNLERVANMLIPATTTEPGESYDKLKELYTKMLGQWGTEMRHVANLVAGFESQQKHIGQEGVIFTPLPRQRQTEAVAFLNEHAFQPMEFALQPEILRRIEPTGAIARISGAQAGVLNAVLNPGRFTRLMEQAALFPRDAYQPTELLADVREGIWGELSDSRVEINAYRRSLQRSHLNLLSQRVGPGTSASDARALYRGELLALDAQVARAQRRARNDITRLHLQDVRAQITWALDPDRQAAAPAGNAGPGNRLHDEQTAGHTHNPLDCWPEYLIN